MEMFSTDGSLLVLFIFIMVFCLLSTVAYLLHYIGILYNVKVSVGKPILSNVWIAYKHHSGPYKDCGPHFTEITSLCPDLDSIAIYYDDPKVNADNLRYIVGAVLCDGDDKPSESLLALLSSQNFHTFQLPLIDHAVKATFPFVFDVCGIVGSWKVYPALAAYIKQHKLSAHPFIEYYSKSTIYYMGPLSKQNDFYVPQVQYNISGSAKISPQRSENDDSQQGSTTDDESQGTASSFEDITADQVE